MSPASRTSDHADRLAGTLLGTALGDALGLPCENLSAQAIARRFGAVEDFHFLGRTGFVSDDTEQSALVAQSLITADGDAAAAERAFGRSLIGWFLRLPWGIGFATLRACLWRMIGVRPSGVMSAGNGAAMRGAVVGVAYRDDPVARRTYGRAIAEVTHRDARAVEGALFVAEVAAAAARVPVAQAAGTDRFALWDQALDVVAEPTLTAALALARTLAARGADTAEAATALGTTGYVVHTVAFAGYCFLAHGAAPLPAIRAAVCAGGDTDSIGAVVGAMVGALHGETGLPRALVTRLHDGPFGPTHLRALAAALAAQGAGDIATVPGYSPAGALLRNLALYPVILGHLVRRLF